MSTPYFQVPKMTIWQLVRHDHNLTLRHRIPFFSPDKSPHDFQKPIVSAHGPYRSDIIRQTTSLGPESNQTRQWEIPRT